MLHSGGYTYNAVLSFEVTFGKITLSLHILKSLEDNTHKVYSREYRACVRGTFKPSKKEIDSVVDAIKSGCFAERTPIIFAHKASELFRHTLIPVLCIG